ncbi:MAG: hypothetical protein JNL08_08445 [Planctomycetes bacterium]|nr:hypothetical protein [Planctomycetota bacterium]
MPSNLAPTLLFLAGIAGFCPSMVAQVPAVEVRADTAVAPLDRLVIDAPGDGAILARGRNWKASFTVRSATFVPFFGSSAPRNFPIDFVFDGVTAGGHVLTTGAAEAPVRESGTPPGGGAQETIVIRRGAVAEQYLLTNQQVEQRFVFARRTGTGDLSVQLRVDSELLVTALDGGGFRFANELGEVHYGRAEAFDATGERTPVTSTLVDGTLRLTVPAAFHDRATFPLTIDPVIQVFSTPLGLPQYFHTDVAHLGSFGGLHAIVYQEVYSLLDSDVFIRFYDDDGFTVTYGWVDISTFNWTAPKVASNARHNQCLVVAARNSLSYSGIWGRTVGFGVSGALEWSSQFAISGIVGGVNVDVGGDPNPDGPVPGNYCVTWQGLDDELHYNIVRTDTSLAHANGVLVDPGTLPVSNPSIAKSCGIGSPATREWIVVWQQQYSATDEDIYGTVIGYTGTVPVQAFLIDYSGASDTNPAVSSKTDPVNGQERFLVTYQRYQPATSFGPAHYDVMASLWTSGLQSLSGTTNLTTLLQMPALRDQTEPCVDSDGARFAVGFLQAWPAISSDVLPYLATVHATPTGSLAVTEYPVGPGTAGVNADLGIAAERSGGAPGSRYVAAWTHAFLDPIFGGTTKLVKFALYAGHLGLSPSQYFQASVPSCGALTLTATGVPAMGDTFSLHLTGAQGVPVLVVGPHVTPVALCGTCQLGVDLNGVALFAGPTTTFTLSADPQWIGTNFGAQGLDLLATGGCTVPFDFTLSNEIIVTIL